MLTLGGERGAGVADHHGNQFIRHPDLPGSYGRDTTRGVVLSPPIAVRNDAADTHPANRALLTPLP